MMLCAQDKMLYRQRRNWSCQQPQRRPREGGDPVSQSVSVQIADAAAYWMPAFAGMTAVIFVTFWNHSGPGKAAKAED
jgi:hypothetical protein